MGDDIQRYTFHLGPNSLPLSEPTEFLLASDHDAAITEHVKAIRVTDERWRKATDYLIDALEERDATIAKLKIQINKMMPIAARDWSRETEKEIAREEAVAERIASLAKTIDTLLGYKGMHERQIDERDELIKQLKRSLSISAEEINSLSTALNRIAIIGSGELAYTSEFTEQVNSIAREALTIEPRSGAV